jgi:hypothetical protein
MMAVVYYACNCRLESLEILIRLLLLSKFVTLLPKAHQLLMPSAKMLVCARKKSIFLTDYYLIMLITPQSLAIIIIIFIIIIVVVVVGRVSVVSIATR